MDQFRKEILVGKEKRMFYFNRLQNMNGVKFFITSHDEANQAISFSLKENGPAAWKLFPGAAQWLYVIESELSDAIVETRL